MSESLKNILLVAAGAAVTFLVTLALQDYFDSSDAASEAEVRRIAAEVYAEKSKTDSGKTVKAELGEVKGAVIANGTKLDVALRMLDELVAE